jgi:hypothetical protein
VPDGDDPRLVSATNRNSECSTERPSTEKAKREVLKRETIRDQDFQLFLYPC